MSKEELQHEIRMKRYLHYREKHSGWHIFNAVYWGIYILIVGLILIFESSLHYTTTISAGVSLVILAVMLVVYGFASALHLKFMKKYG